MHVPHVLILRLSRKARLFEASRRFENFKVSLH